MSDEVGVDVERIGQLASALENLRSVLAANVPTIVNTMNSYWSSGTGSPISLQPLQQAQSRSVDDATDIRDRATMAVAYQNRPNPTMSGDMVEIPWDSSQQQLDADSSKAAAQNLAAAEADAKTNPKLAKAQIAAIQADMQDNLDSKDTGWVKDFYNNGGAAAAANLAQTLHNLETPNQSADYTDRFEVLNSADQKTVATFANGLAIADKAGLSTQAVQSLVNSPNMWSTAMLVKYGPSGSSWATNEPGNKPNSTEPSLLAQLTVATYKDLQNGKIDVPVGFGGRYNQQDMNQLDSTLSSNDPLQVLMKADTQNKNAAWQVMGNKQYGSDIANMLLSSQHGDLPGIDGRYAQLPGSDGQYTGTFQLIPPGKSVPQQDDFGAISINTPDQNVVGAFLDAATSAPRTAVTNLQQTNTQESTQAALNIIMATQAPILGKGTVQPGYSPAIIKALSDTFTRYMPDIAFSAHQYGGSPEVTQYVDSNGKTYKGTYILRVPGSDLTSFLQEISSTPTNYATMKGAVATAAGTAEALQLKGVIVNGTDPYADLSALYGDLIQQNNNLNYSSATIKDTYDTQLNAEVSFAENFVSDIPVVGNVASTTLSYDQQLSALGIPQVPQFSTNNAATAAATAKSNLNKALMMGMVPIVQGLAKHGVPVGTKETGWVNVQQVGTQEGWYKDGKVVPNSAFWNWVGTSEGAWVVDNSAMTTAPGTNAPLSSETQLSDVYQKLINNMQLGVNVNNTTGS